MPYRCKSQSGANTTAVFIITAPRVNSNILAAKFPNLSNTTAS